MSVIKFAAKVAVLFDYRKLLPDSSILRIFVVMEELARIHYSAMVSFLSNETSFHRICGDIGRGLLNVFLKQALTLTC